jgi:hypothetical protein
VDNAFRQLAEVEHMKEAESPTDGQVKVPRNPE